jgi:hypothetical protein
MKTIAAYKLTATEALERIENVPDLRRLYQEAVTVLRRDTAEALRCHIELGRIGIAVKQDPGRKLKSTARIHGDGAVDLMARALGMHRSTFRRAIHVVEVFSAEQLDTFLTRESVDGFLITPSHLRVILPVPAAADRNKMIEYFYEHSPTVKQLCDEAAPLIGLPNRATPRARSLAAVVAKFGARARALHADLAVDSELELIAKLQEFVDGKGESGPDELALVSRVREHLESLQEDIDAALVVTTKAVAALQDRLGAAA